MIVSFKINRAKVLLTAGLCVAAAAAFLYFRYETKSAETMAQAENARVIPMVTAELKAKGPDGKDVEVYRWSPDTIPVKKGEAVTLSIRGFNGDDHHFVIEGLGVKGQVKKGKETTVSFTAEKEGIYKIVCLNHSDASHEGPMVGYIVVN
ncbi:cupredoxin domain-containing protein [Paenibacillus aurantius]|uniref:Cupredoxin domain-containing protein n=1 Tax=Paenibacillus aurantius TaxID=2918900 RepID=A0AA96RFW4_9BACL|nr:cupredoxin domain-containing protein [Paenibacillus aurantius]WNQ12432.1 cupredoxin domain-containing protein [Paenibacillus aurantius]